MAKKWIEKLENYSYGFTIESMEYNFGLKIEIKWSKEKIDSYSSKFFEYAKWIEKRLKDEETWVLFIYNRLVSQIKKKGWELTHSDLIKAIKSEIGETEIAIDTEVVPVILSVKKDDFYSEVIAKFSKTTEKKSNTPVTQNTQNIPEIIDKEKYYTSAFFIDFWNFGDSPNFGFKVTMKWLREDFDNDSNVDYFFILKQKVINILKDNEEGIPSIYNNLIKNRNRELYFNELGIVRK